MTTIQPSELPLRTKTFEQKIPKEVTGLRGSLFVHVDYVSLRGPEDDNPPPGFRKVVGIRLSEKGKDGSTLERILNAQGDVLTAIFCEEINAPESDGPHIVRDGAV